MTNDEVAVNNDPAFYKEMQLQEVRTSRDLLLKLSDWTQLLDNPLTQEKRLEFADYRQQLRDITEPLKNSTARFGMDGIQWPTKPEL